MKRKPPTKQMGVQANRTLERTSQHGTKMLGCFIRYYSTQVV